MKLTIRLIPAVIILFSLIGGLFILQGIKHRNERDRLSTALISAQEQLIDSVQTYQILVNGQREILAEQRTLIMSQKDAIAAGVLQIERLRAANIKQVKENTLLKTQITVLKDSLEMDSTQIIYVVDSSGVNYPCLKLPNGMFYKDEWLGLGVTVFEDAQWSFNLNMGLDVNVTTGYKKTGLFGREPVASVTSPNPYLDIIHVQSVSIKNEPMFWDKTWFKVLSHSAAFAGGFYLGGR